MDNFVYDIPTAIYFGKGQIQLLGAVVSRYGARALLVYGGGSIKKNGIYEQATKVLINAGVQCWELAGVEPNPRIETVRRGVQICKENDIQVVVPIGGGSVIDCGKVVSAGACYAGDAWELVEDGGRIQQALPIIPVLTLAATGSEMDSDAVISDTGTNRKQGTSSPWMLPKVSFMDPTYTESVNAWQTACGAADIMSHTLENYFSNRRAFLQERLAEAILKTCIEFAPRALEDPHDYEARANLLWAGSWACNGFLKLGKTVRFSVHPIEHQLSAHYDLTHGAGMAILTPHWMRYVLDDTSVQRFQEYAVNVWGVSAELEPFAAAEEAIQKTAEFLKSLGMPGTLSEVGITDEKFGIMAESAAARMKGTYRDLSKEQIEELLRKAL